MRSHRNAVLDLFENFTEYTLSLIPREKNMIVDALATSASVFKIPINPNKKYEVQVKHKPTILDNVRHWKVFEDDKQICIFLVMAGEFENTHIDEENLFMYEDQNSASQEYLNVIIEEEILQLKNCIPKGLVPLEDIFDKNGITKTLKVTPNSDEVEDYNKGTEADPKI